MLWIENDQRTIPVEQRPSWASCLVLLATNVGTGDTLVYSLVTYPSYLRPCTNQRVLLLLAGKIKRDVNLIILLNV